MEQYIPKSVVLAEIKKLIGNPELIEDWRYRVKMEEKNELLKSIINTINTFEVKEVDLEKETDKWYNNEASKEFENVLYKDIEKCAKHFFELGLKAKKGEVSVNDGLKETQKNIWRSLDEKPSFPISNDELLCSILVLYNNGNMFLYRYGKNGIPNDLLTPHFCNIMNAKWCYCKDVINK